LTRSLPNYRTAARRDVARSVRELFLPEAQSFTGAGRPRAAQQLPGPEIPFEVVWMALNPAGVSTRKKSVLAANTTVICAK